MSLHNSPALRIDLAPVIIITMMMMMMVMITMRLKIQDYFQSGGTTLPEYTPGGITKSELAWRLQWTKNAIINQHARGGIT